MGRRIGQHQHMKCRMRAKRRLKIVFCVAAAAATLSATCAAVHAEESTAVQRQACKPDVYRLCKWYIPSHAGINYCLHQNIDHLSPECRAVMEGRLR
jgi:UDP-N-acetylglucosamine enolpyruvyl transferase